MTETNLFSITGIRALVLGPPGAESAAEKAVEFVRAVGGSVTAIHPRTPERFEEMLRDGVETYDLIITVGYTGLNDAMCVPLLVRELGGIELPGLMERSRSIQYEAGREHALIEDGFGGVVDNAAVLTLPAEDHAVTIVLTELLTLLLQLSAHMGAGEAAETGPEPDADAPVDPPHPGGESGATILPMRRRKPKGQGEPE